jgi:putative membrane protein
VFIFLLVYLVLAIPAWGWRRTFAYLILGYSLAWLAEFSSIHTGFPFGKYTYIQDPTIDREIWVAGVPLMDSLSFVFLSFAGLQTARLLVEPLVNGQVVKWDFRWENPSSSLTWRVWFLAGLLTMGMDIIIDPVALRGEKWFLGQIYFYPTGGHYFGVPLANFAGWALLAWTITGVFLLLDRRIILPHWGNWHGYPFDALGGAALFFGVIIFNLGVTFAIGELSLALVGSLLFIGILLLVLARLRRSIPGLEMPVSNPSDPFLTSE